MTRPRLDDGGSNFSNWLRGNKNLDSKTYACSDIDYFWTNYKNGHYVLLEEKTHMAEPTYSQSMMFKKLNKVLKADKDYKGFYLLQFEGEGVDDGKIFLNHREISKKELELFLVSV